MKLRALAGLVIAVALTTLMNDRAVVAQGDPARPPRERAAPEMCATGRDWLRQLGLRPRTAIADGQGLSYRQDPPVLESDYTGTITLHDFTIAGDVPSVDFKLDFDGSEVETWSRTATRMVNGRMVSVFEPSWRVASLDRVLRGTRWGWDYPGLYWGQLLTAGTAPDKGWPVYLRMATTSLPHVRTVRVSETVQYTSHVVNIVMPNFGDGYANDDHGFDLQGVAGKFFQDFEDSYDSIAVVPEQTFIATYGAFHRNVQNAVRGIGLGVFDE